MEVLHRIRLPLNQKLDLIYERPLKFKYFSHFKCPPKIYLLKSVDSR